MKVLAFVSVLLTLSLAGCRQLPAPSGSPMGAGTEGESLSAGVVRSDAVLGQRPFHLIAAGERAVNEIARLLEAGGVEGPVSLRFAGLQNRSNLPEPSFRGMRYQILQSLRYAGEKRGFEIVEGETADFVVDARVVGSLDRDGTFFLEYRVKRESAG